MRSALTVLAVSWLCGCSAIPDFDLAFVPAAINELGKPVVSNEVEVRLSTSQTAHLTAGTLVVNGVDTGQSEATLVDHDKVAIRLVSPASYAGPSSTITATLTIGAKSGSFALTIRYPPPAAIAQLGRGCDVQAVAPAANGKHLYVGSLCASWSPNGGSDPFEVFDLQGGTGPTRVGSASGIAVARLVATSCDVVAALSAGSITIIDVSNPTSPAARGTIDGSTFALAGDCSTAFVTAGSELRVYDVSDLTAPTQIATVAISNACAWTSTDQAIALSPDGTTLYVAAGNVDLNVFDVVAPTAPLHLSEVSQCDDPADLRGLHVSRDGSTGHVLAKSTRVIDLRDRANPVIAATLALGALNDVAVRESPSELYVGGRGVLRVISTSNPSQPVVLFEIVSSALPGEPFSGSYPDAMGIATTVAVSNDDRYVFIGANAGSYLLLGRAGSVLIVEPSRP